MLPVASTRFPAAPWSTSASRSSNPSTAHPRPRLQEIALLRPSEKSYHCAQPVGHRRTPRFRRDANSRALSVWVASIVPARESWRADGRAHRCTHRSGTAACEARALESSHPTSGAVPRPQRPGPRRPGAGASATSCSTARPGTRASSNAVGAKRVQWSKQPTTASRFEPPMTWSAPRSPSMAIASPSTTFQSGIEGYVPH